ncbi:alpha/beta fold hydrolase [Methylobacterium sp. WSM2598]|uniref:alpha/beta fold hydrolase n=1 Tax=Methylobacterium sp. WSM2598 TaxID=398261 RepID=UPI0003815130|nr:alpha/beta hydrolase [Methylobacterium sp. WSM2598]
MIDLVLLPGLLNDADLWRDQVEALSDIARIRVGDITRGDTIEAVADQVLAEAPQAFALAGFSLGGIVAQEILRRAAARVTRLALLDTTIAPDGPERAASRRALDRAARVPGRFHGFGDRLLATYLHPSHRGDAEIVGRIRAMTERLGPEIFRRQNGLERRDGSALLRGWRKPLLILCGEADAVTPLADHRAMAALAPGARLVVVPESGHLTPIEQPAAVSRALRDWLAEAGAPLPGPPAIA